MQTNHIQADGDVFLCGGTSDELGFFGADGQDKLEWAGLIGDTYSGRLMSFTAGPLDTTADQLSAIRAKILQIVSDLKSYGLF